MWDSPHSETPDAGPTHHGHCPRTFLRGRSDETLSSHFPQRLTPGSGVGSHRPAPTFSTESHEGWQRASISQSPAASTALPNVTKIQNARVLSARHSSYVRSWGERPALPPSHVGFTHLPGEAKAKIRVARPTCHRPTLLVDVLINKNIDQALSVFSLPMKYIYINSR